MAAPIINRLKSFPNHTISLQSLGIVCRNCYRYFQTSAHNSKKKDLRSRTRVVQDETSIVPFEVLLEKRYKEARRSVVIRTERPQSCLRLLMSHGVLVSAYHPLQDKRYLIAEFSNERSVKQLQSCSTFFDTELQFPMPSRLLFDYSGEPRSSPHHKLPKIREDLFHTESMEEFPFLETLDAELRHLCSRRALNDLDIRMRFLICLMVEDAVSALIPGCRVIPYGSCLNGFGWWNSDLDMMLCLKDPFREETGSHGGRTRTNFKFLSTQYGTERLLAQTTLNLLASLLGLMPFNKGLTKILKARVPIVRYQQIAFNLECDISLEAIDSHKMTEMLYLMSSCDSRVRPLLTGIKQWAICHNLTSGGEQQKFTTIGLISLLIFYLQTLKVPILPTLQKLRQLSGTNDLFKIDNVVHGLPYDPNVIPKSKNNQTIDELLHGFFKFYSEFDFSTNAISIIEGSTYPKPKESSPVYVENPLAIGLNICQNVNERQLNNTINTMRESAEILETLREEKPNDGRSFLDVLFGKTENSSTSQRTVQISDLFEEEAEQDDTVLVEEVRDIERVSDDNEHKINHIEPSLSRSHDLHSKLDVHTDFNSVTESSNRS